MDRAWSHDRQEAIVFTTQDRIRLGTRAGNKLGSLLGEREVIGENRW